MTQFFYKQKCCTNVFSNVAVKIAYLVALYIILSSLSKAHRQLIYREVFLQGRGYASILAFELLFATLAPVIGRKIFWFWMVRSFQPNLITLSFLFKLPLIFVEQSNSLIDLEITFPKVYMRRFERFRTIHTIVCNVWHMKVCDVLSDKFNYWIYFYFKIFLCIPGEEHLLLLRCDIFIRAIFYGLLSVFKIF